MLLPHQQEDQRSFQHQGVGLDGVGLCKEKTVPGHFTNERMTELRTLRTSHIIRNGELIKNTATNEGQQLL